MVFFSASVISSSLLSWDSNYTQRFWLCLLVSVSLQSSPVCAQLSIQLRTQGHLCKFFLVLFSCSWFLYNTLLQNPSHFSSPKFWVLFLSPSKSIAILVWAPLPCTAIWETHTERVWSYSVLFCFVFAKIITSGGTFHFAVNSLFISLLFRSSSYFRDTNSLYDILHFSQFAVNTLLCLWHFNFLTHMIIFLSTKF